MSEVSLQPMRRTTSVIAPANRWDHFLARWGVNRSGHRVEPGLYALGNPTQESPVFVTSNYTLSFDALRSALAGVDGYILVLDTQGINVWCAAGKGTFGTDELVNRIKVTRLADVVGHRTLILPQLGAPGVAAHQVKSRTGFRVEYGPVRADDLPEYLKTRVATPQMRRVRFSLFDRLVLIPVELVYVLPAMLIAALVLFFLNGGWAAAGAATAILSGVVLFPILLPWLPTSDLSTKGFILGGATALPFAAGHRLSDFELYRFDALHVQERSQARDLCLRARHGLVIWGGHRIDDCSTSDPDAARMMVFNSYTTNTLRYNPELCVNCGMCSAVCPQGVFASDDSVARLVRPTACMECGACQLNCPSGAIMVDSGVGCAAAMIRAALSGRKQAKNLAKNWSAGFSLLLQARTKVHTPEVFG